MAENMAVELTPKGTHGVKMRQLPRPIMKIILKFVTLILRLRGAKVLALTTVGAKSGRTHTTDVGAFPDGENRWLIVASYAGAANHPAWFYNMARNPDKVWIKLDGRKLKVLPKSLKGQEREAKFKEIAAVAPTFGEYQTKTDREIPVVRLTAAPG
jgi:deazaflavin-dependent oxidoreductase (nitroreductase family)